ncbi:hypothetical protein ES288_A11G236900v1 [Gossypium darwinii]|uniref:Alcohol dehydrogenase-like N-terminal domain-containing protein n=1 Tax=Gossypium darwinii TaxID=34276 RepID=A0A5D2ENG9_GOSDA|nr:hypothetical protein ES288_A11G236900v1 [Gossypium darwinii]
MIKNEWGNTVYPFLPGHEIVGEVTEVGSKVTKFKVGDRVGVGCMVGSCRSSHECANDLENYCSGVILTSGAKYHDRTITYGVHSDWMVADQHFVVLIPDNLPLNVAAPLLCAGISMYSPLRYNGLDKPSLHIGVVGLGGLGHLASKQAKQQETYPVSYEQENEDYQQHDHQPLQEQQEEQKPCPKQSLQAHILQESATTDVSTARNYETVTPNRADSFLVNREQDQLQAAMGTMDGILDTVSAKHPLLPLLELLKKHGKLILVGAPTQAHELPAFPLLGGRKLVGGNVIGGMKETQEMLDFAAKHNVKPKIEVVVIDYVNTAIRRLEKTNVKYQFVIDIENTLKPSSN